MTNTFHEHAGCQWFLYTGSGQAEFPTNGQGATSTDHLLSKCFGAQAVVIYQVDVVAGVGGDTFQIGTADAAGSTTALTGFSALDCGTSGTQYKFPGGLRVTSMADSANLYAKTNVDASTLRVFYRKL